ncbi:hypothetical protein EW026_g4934 [Hermanssonia centrifuga]|uniref:Nucleoporin NUP188 n=1 Tax=Hermanssonia centrifuga TaxID=98765 RepID=A0A4S4KHF5_9APHY|nr:hypothetical protein EW026_g4934 [Hermanssonia centrifuga]
MSGETSKRSNLIDVTYQHLHSLLSGHLEGTTVEQISDILRPRAEQLGNVSEPFGKPSGASKKKVETGLVKLRDGVILRVEKADKEYIYAISKKFDIDEVEALILLRSFLYNEGLPASSTGASSANNLVDELVEAITPFYYSERLFILRALIPLFRANAGGSEPVSEVANSFLPQILPDGKAFARSLIAEYVKKTQTPLSEGVQGDPRRATSWAKQNVKEQLVILEVLFWTMWDYASCDGPLVVHIYETAYEANLGAEQANSTLLLDQEGFQLLQDSAAMWILIMTEVLELERVAEPGGIEISADPQDKEIYWSTPEYLLQIHELVISHTDSQFACTYIAWAFILSRLVRICTDLKELPLSYGTFFETIVPPLDRTYSKGREPAHELMCRACLNPEAGLFSLMLTLLTNSPLFVTSVAWKTGSTVTDPNAVAYRSVFKGLLISIVELVPVEMVPDFEALVEVWIALFGRSERQSVAGICRQFWEADWYRGIARRAILDVARSRFPVQSKPLIRLLRAMTASGFLDTDPLSTADHGFEGETFNEDRELCAQRVFLYLDKLPTYTQVVPSSACSGPHALYEKLPERLVSSSVSTGPMYANLRPIKLPGGSTLRTRSLGRLLNGDAGDVVVLSWQHEHSGWKVLLEILTDYVNRRRMAGGNDYQDISFARRKEVQAHVLRLEDTGVEMDRTGDDALVTDVLDLVRSIVQDNPELAEQLLESLESGEPVVAHSMLEAQPPDLVQLTTMILDEALSRSTQQHRSTPCPQLITSAMSVLAALLALPKYSNRVWLYIRSTTSLFGSERAVGFTSAVLAVERLTGHYTMTLALLHLVRQLFNEASSSVLTVLQESPRLQQMKEEVLMRAARFVHSEVWVEHVGWKYAQLGDRFEIGRRVSTFYTDVLKHSPPGLKDAPFAKLSQALSEALISRATPSAVNPLISSLTTSSSVSSMLYAARRYGDARRLIYMLQSHLLLIRMLLNYKQHSTLSSKSCLLEQALCTRLSGNTSSLESASSRVDPVDALATYVKERTMGSIVPVEAMEVLYALCSSLSSSQGASPTIIGHLSDPEATVASLVRIVLHPYDDALLRNAVWNFITLAVDKEPALAGLFVSGHFSTPSVKGKERATEENDTKRTVSALTVACNMLEQWKELWELNPQLLASLLRFLDVVWEHSHEHKTSLTSVRADADFFGHLVSIIREELGPSPDYRTENFLILDGVQRSELHEAVSGHAYRTVVKAHALHIIALDIRMSIPSQAASAPTNKPLSYTTIQGLFKTEEEIEELISEAAVGAYDPSVHDDVNRLIKAHFPTLTLEQLRLEEPLVAREYGDEFAFSSTLLQFRLQPFTGLEEQTTNLLKDLSSVNLNLSLATAQTTLTESWQHLLLQVVPFLRGDVSVRRIFLSFAATVSGGIASEKRSGDMMSTIHNARLSLLLSLLEVAWFSTSDKSDEVQHFVELVKNLSGIINNVSQPPAKSFLRQLTVPFHRSLLQIAYFCARHARSLFLRPKTLNADQRLTINMTLDGLLNLVIDALRVTFDSARLNLDIDIDQDMELLVTVFEQCTRPELNPSPSLWLTRCQETDVIRASLQLFSNMDVVGFSDFTLLRAGKQPLYAPHVLVFHMTLASLPSAAERLASEGVLTAYNSNSLSNIIRSGSLDVSLPEIPGERSPAHQAYCAMLAVVSGVTTALGSHARYFVTDVCGLVQLYGDQIHRALSWTIGDTLTIPLLEEIEQSVNLFFSVSATAKTARDDEAVKRALDFFTSDALLLLQQINYALTHHNHLASLFEPVTAEERAAYEAESNSSIAASSDMAELVKRPFLARIVHRLFRISGSILTTLVNIGKGETVLLGESEEWPINQALIVPHSKATVRSMFFAI